MHPESAISVRQLVQLSLQGLFIFLLASLAISVLLDIFTIYALDTPIALLSSILMPIFTPYYS